MARPVTIRNETIVDAARQVFLERGIQATTAEVAARAGVSEGSVFKRFRTKVELFRAAMGAELEGPAWLEELHARVGRGDLRDNLIELGLEMIAFFRKLLPMCMMAWSNPAADGLPFMISGPNPPPLRALKKLAAFFEGEMRLGRIRAHSAEICARMFLGSMNHYVFTEVLHRNSDELPPAPEDYVRGLVDLLLGGAGATTEVAVPYAFESANTQVAVAAP